MTYAELLIITAEKKRKAVRELNAALRGDAGFLVKAEMERNPGTVAWAYLAREFCESLVEHIDEMADEMEDNPEIFNIYSAYMDGDTDLYSYLPTEARLFDS